ncbi:hypothetical protein [Nocardioides sp. WS12]|uniref:hypothetical protein n=1 Tax=Nocardioides sp. WS12 TaxID=2486272 RepID=UPI0015FDDEBB|nr:hypothetical protein [Nocardioides sp. WS12]
MDSAVLGRRALLLGAAATTLTGCSGSSSDPKAGASSSPSSSGPIIHGQDAGTVILDADIDALMGELNGALTARDPRAMAALIPGLDVSVWQGRLDTLAKFPVKELRFGVDRTYLGRQSNASGGPLNTDLSLFLIHQIEGADGLPVVQQYSAKISKDGPKAALALSDVEGPDGYNSPAPWDLKGDWQVLTAEHAVLAFRSSDRAAAQRWLKPLSEGVGRALQVITAPGGATKVLLTMDKPDSPLFLAGKAAKDSVVRDRAGFASMADYLDPEKLTVEDETGGKGVPFYTGRIVIHPTFITGDGYASDLAAHETAHALAGQWGFENPTWATEGFAMWVESDGGSGVMSRYGGTIRSAFPSYRARMKGNEGLSPGDFQSGNVNANYYCSAAIFAYVEDVHGRAKMLDLIRELYSKYSAVDQSMFKKVGARNLGDLMAKTAAWL